MNIPSNDIFMIGRCMVRKIRTLACLIVILTIGILYFTVTVSNRGLGNESIITHRGMFGKDTSHRHGKNQAIPRSRLNSVAVMGTDISSGKLKLLSTQFKYLFVLPHSTHEIKPARDARFISNVDKLKLEQLIEFLDYGDDYHASTCHGVIQKPSEKEKLEAITHSCHFEKRNWTVVIRNDGRRGSKETANRLVNFIECNMFEGAFVIRREIFENFHFDTDYGDTVVLDFFLRSQGRLRLAALSGCSFSEVLHRRDRGALNNDSFYTDYVKLGLKHNIVRIIRENQIIWTKCTKNLKLCPEKPLRIKTSLSRQLKPVCCSQVLDRLLVDVVKAMNAVGLDYRVEYGTLLGAVRSGTIIPWTKDVDIGLREDDYFNDKKFDKLKAILKGKRYSLSVVKGQRRVLPLFPPQQMVNVSLFKNPFRKQLFSEKIIRMIKRMLRAKTIPTWQDLGYLDFYIAKKERFDSLTTVKINGRDYATFANVKQVLKDWYGPKYMKAVKKSSAASEINIVKRGKERKRKEKKARKKRRARQKRANERKEKSKRKV